MQKRLVEVKPYGWYLAEHNGFGWILIGKAKRRSEMGKQIEGPQKAWDHAKETGAPPMVKSHEKAHGRAMDPSKGPAPDSGQTAGGSRQGGKKGGTD